MLFVSPHPGYMLTGVVQPRDHHHPATGEYMSTTPGIDVLFRHGRLPAWAETIALETFTFHGIPEGAEPLTYLSGFDTDAEAVMWGWDEETREKVEQFLLSNVDYGSRYVLVEHPGLTPPYPNYVEATTVKGRRTIQAVCAKVESLIAEDGYDVGQVLLFEKLAKRPESEAIIETIQELKIAEPEEDLVSA